MYFSVINLKLSQFIVKCLTFKKIDLKNFRSMLNQSYQGQ